MATAAPCAAVRVREGVDLSPIYRKLGVGLGREVI